jgi:hypothetical protein
MLAIALQQSLEPESSQSAIRSTPARRADDASAGAGGTLDEIASGLAAPSTRSASSTGLPVGPEGIAAN